MKTQKIHFDLSNFPSKQAPSSFRNRPKNMEFYLPKPKIKQSPEKPTTINHKNNFKGKKKDDLSLTQSKYLCINSNSEESKQNNAEKQLISKNIIHSIKYKRSLEHSKQDEDPLNFTYFSKDLAFTDKKPANYHILKDFLSPIKKKNTLFSNNLKSSRTNNNNNANTQNDSKEQNTEKSKKLPEISKDQAFIDKISVYQSKDADSKIERKTHKKTNALDYKPAISFLVKKEFNDSKSSKLNLGQTFSTMEQTNELLPVATSENNEKCSWNDIKKPASSKIVLEDYGDMLTSYEKSEILNFKEIFYLSAHKKSKIQGFEDRKGYYIANIGDHIFYRYEVKEELGKGTFGKVFRVYDHKKQQEFAIKIMKKDKIYYAQALNEIKILNFLREKDFNNSSNIVKILNYFTFRGHVCIVFELLSLSLYSFLKLNGFCGLNFDLIRKFAIQIFQCLSFLYKYRIIHCDLKPENILLKNLHKSGIKIIDFGSSCFLESRCYTYLQSRYYRSPELIFGHDYNVEIDVWSMGCILAELYIGTPLFPGDDEIEMASMICDVCGMPDVHFLKESKKKDKFFEFNDETNFNFKGGLTLNKVYSSKTLGEILGCDNEDFIDLIKKCLTLDPRKRIKPYAALIHPWIINELPQEIKPVYLRECNELKNDIESYQKLEKEKMILINENSLQKSKEQCPKSNSVEKHHDLKYTKERKNLNNLNIAQNEEKIKCDPLKVKSVEKKQDIAFDKNNRFKNIKNIKGFRKINGSIQRKSITFHQSTEQSYFVN